MKFCVDYDKLSDIGKFTLEKSETFDGIYNDLIKICNELDTSWRSEDSSVYLGRMSNYISNKIKENEDIVTSGLVLNKISSRYSDQDNKWEKDLIDLESMYNERN
jgi:hypothetical protein